MLPSVNIENKHNTVHSFSASRNESISSEKPEIDNQNKKESFNMLIKEMLLCLVLAATTYAALHNVPIKIAKHPQPVQFFTAKSPVTDWYKGQLNKALVNVNQADVSFVMYYAPWDAECQYVRSEFERTANILGDRVHFAAINCWNPGSDCRLQHWKIPSWPILVASTVNLRGILYKGPRDAHHMVNFLELIMKPMKRVSSTEDLVSLLSVCDAVALGFTPLAETSKYYSTWYSVALKIKEFDTVGEICFAVVTSKTLIQDFGVDSVPNARLMLWNDTKEYKIDQYDLTHWNESALMMWVLDNFVQPVSRIIPLWKKSFSFEKFVDGNPILMLFTPMNPVHAQLPSYELLKEVAMEYYNCKDYCISPWTTELIKLQQIQRLMYQQKKFLKFCQEYDVGKPKRKTKQFYKKIVVSNKYPWTNSSNKPRRSGMFDFLKINGLSLSGIDDKDDGSQMLSSLNLLKECSTKAFPAEKEYYDYYEQCQSFDEVVNEEVIQIETTMLPLEDDPLSPENLIQDNLEHFCKMIRFANERSPPVFPGKVKSSNITHIQGLACENNFTLYMLAVDSVENHHFVESLGIDVLNKKDKTAVVILDSKHESQYVLSDEYNPKTIRDFISNFTSNKLRRSLRSRIDRAVHTHYFASSSNHSEEVDDEMKTKVLDLTTKTFRRLVRTPGVVTLVAVCGGSCGWHVTRALLEASRLARACGVQVTVARIDALRHDLPVHYTAPVYPTVFALRPDKSGEADSRTYPPDTRITSGGLVALALRSLGAPQHLSVRLALAGLSQSYAEKVECLKDMRVHVTTLIVRNLKYLRRTLDRKLKDALFRRLQHLHRVSLQLSVLHITDLQESNAKQVQLLDSLSTLAKNWDIDVSILSKNVTSSLKKS